MTFLSAAKAIKPWSSVMCLTRQKPWTPKCMQLPVFTGRAKDGAIKRTQL